MRHGSVKFSDIFKQVYRRTGGHGLTSRLDALKDRRAARLEDIGVRPLSRTMGVQDTYGRYGPEESIYHAAHEALKKSNKPWASESEIKAILYGDKKLSHERSAEVVEVLRRARIPGFRETDEVTEGDVYSERMLGVIGAQQKEKLRDARHNLVKKMMEKDAAATRDSTENPAATDEEQLPSHGQISMPAIDPPSGEESDLQRRQHSSPAPRAGDDAPFIGIPLSKKRQTKAGGLKEKKTFTPNRDNKGDEEKEVPLAFNLKDD